MSPEQDPADKRQRILAVFLCLLLLATGGILVYNHVRSSAAGTAVTRKPFDFVVEWLCLACGQTERANAAIGPRKCPKCGKNEYYVSIPWACPTHGQVPVAFQYNEDGDTTQVKVETGPWVQAIDEQTGWNIFCPVCKQRMVPAGAGP